MEQHEIVAPAGSQTSRRQGPPRHKVAFLTWVGAYGVITLILELLGPLMAPWPLPLRTLLLSALMVAALTWIVMPTLGRLFRGWLLAPTMRELSPQQGADGVIHGRFATSGEGDG